jgi:hypothetical protein
MAELVKSFVTLDKDGGSGNGTVIASANSNNTGRVARQVTFNFSAVNVTPSERTIIQRGKGEATSIQATAAAQKTGQTLTLTGTSNSSKLTFSKGTDDIGLTIPSTYKANTIDTDNGAAIAGDPGATAEYPFSIQFTVPANEDVEPKTCQIVVTDEGGNSYTCVITLAAGDAYLTVGEPSGELAWDGSNTVTIAVQSNTSWTIA